MSGVRLPNRRGVIRGLAGLALGGALAGCFEQRPNEAYRIGRLEGVNRTTNPHDVGIRISVGDETVYEKIHRIGPDSEDSGSGGFVVDTDLPDSNRPYQVEAKLDAGDWKTTLAPERVDTSCVDLLYLIEATDGSNAATLSEFASGCGSEH